MQSIPRRWLRNVTLLGLGLLILPALADSAVRGSADRDAWKDNLKIHSPEEIGRMMAEGKRVIWVDVREPQEFDEFHVPNALPVPLRTVEDFPVEQLAGADLVVPYCLKDFRGYEGAKKLQQMGVQNVGLAEGFGINSWRKAEMPVAGVHPDMSDVEALQALSRLLESQGALEPPAGVLDSAGVSDDDETVTGGGSGSSEENAP